MRILTRFLQLFEYSREPVYIRIISNRWSCCISLAAYRRKIVINGVRKTLFRDSTCPARWPIGRAVAFQF